MEHFVYIIESVTSGGLYYGYSTDLEKRLDGHNKGLNTSTRYLGPWKLIFKRSFSSKVDALQFERDLKKPRNKNYIKNRYHECFI